MLLEMLNQTQYAIFYSVIDLSFSIGRCFRVCRYIFFFGGGGRGTSMARLKFNVTFGILRIAHYRQIK